MYLVINKSFKYFGNNTQNRNRPVITNCGFVTIILKGNNSMSISTHLNPFKCSSVLLCLYCLKAVSFWFIKARISESIQGSVCCLILACLTGAILLIADSNTFLKQSQALVTSLLSKTEFQSLDNRHATKLSLL